MAKYVVLFKLTSESVAGMIQKPSDRRAVVAKAAETAGGKLLDYYWMFGQYDGRAFWGPPVFMYNPITTKYTKFTKWFSCLS